MKSISILLALVLLFALTAGTGLTAAKPDKETICHNIKFVDEDGDGTPDAAVGTTIEVSENAVDAHLRNHRDVRLSFPGTTCDNVAIDYDGDGVLERAEER